MIARRSDSVSWRRGTSVAPSPTTEPAMCSLSTVASPAWSAAVVSAFSMAASADRSAAMATRSGALSAAVRSRRRLVRTRPDANSGEETGATDFQRDALISWHIRWGTRLDTTSRFHSELASVTTMPVLRYTATNSLPPRYRQVPSAITPGNPVPGIRSPRNSRHIALLGATAVTLSSGTRIEPCSAPSFSIGLNRTTKSRPSTTRQAIPISALVARAGRQANGGPMLLARHVYPGHVITDAPPATQRLPGTSVLITTTAATAAPATTTAGNATPRGVPSVPHQLSRSWLPMFFDHSL